MRQDKRCVMTEEDGQTEENAENIVRTTVRMGAALHARFIDYVHERGRGLPPRKRPSMDAIIQEAVEARIAKPGPVPISEKSTAQTIDNQRAWTNSKVTVPEPATNSEQRKLPADISRLSVLERTCFDRLLRILTSGDSATISAIDRNLERFDKLVELLRGASASEAPEHADAKNDPRVGEAEGIADRALEDREPGGGSAGGVSRESGKPLRRRRKGA